ncbi:MAG: type II toxin-antitoxin system VapC family toxin [Candidatus Binatia bacterium]
MRVADASVVSALLFGEPRGAEAAQLLAGEEVAAPDLLPYEVASVCLKKMRRRPKDAERLLLAHRLLPRLSITFHPVDHVAVLDLARESRLTTYDASYLWLARRLGAELLTFDQRLGRAAAAD